MKSTLKPEIVTALKDFKESSPVIYHMLQKALQDPENSFDDFAALINADPKLTAHLLNIVNSPHFGFSSEIENISHAISIVGLNQLIDLALSTEVVSLFKGIHIKNFNAEAFWVHSLACGLGARAIAIKIGESNPESFYLAGLLHDIGQIVIVKKFPRESMKIFSASKSGNKDLSSLEIEFIGFSHNEVGKVLLESWRLPRRVVQAIQFHHSPMEAGNYQFEASIIYVADNVAYDLKIGSSREFLVRKPRDEILKLLNLNIEYLENLRKEIQDQVNQTAKILID